MSLLTQFFSSPSNIVQLDLLEITHPNFSQTYRIVRNCKRRLAVPTNFGISGITHEGPAGPFEYTYCPFSLKPVGSGSDLTQALAVTLGDLGDIIRKEIAVVTAANKMHIRPTLKFRTYRSDVLSAPMFGPLVLEIKDVTCSEEGSSFAAIAPQLNNSRTGVRYTREQFPMLRGFFT
jgi:uncharacterized protein DUF1833